MNKKSGTSKDAAGKLVKNIRRKTRRRRAIEEDKCTPISSYGVSKLASEGYVTLLGKQFDISTLILRISNPVGPGQTGFDGQGVVAVFNRLMRQGNDIKVFGKGTSLRDYVDVTEAMQAVAELTRNGAIGVFNIGSGRSNSILDVVSALEGATGLKAKKTFIKAASEADRGDIRIDVSKLAKTLGWSPQSDLDQIVANYTAWYNGEFEMS